MKRLAVLVALAGLALLEGGGIALAAGVISSVSG